MKKVYISHPLRGSQPYTRSQPYTQEQCERNIERITNICRVISAKEHNIVPLSPIHAFSFMHPLTCDYDKVMTYCFELLEQCDELWIFENWKNSSGCTAEIREFLYGAKDHPKRRLVFASFDDAKQDFVPLKIINFGDESALSDLIDYVI